MRFFIQLAWEAKLLTTIQHALLLKSLEEVGRMLGGWKKGLILRRETPAGAGEIR
jgi:hypothetical protein